MPQRLVKSECYLECKPPRVNVVRGRPVSQGVWNDMIPHWFHTRVWSGISLRGSLTYQAGLLGWALRLGLRPYHWCFH